MVDQSLNDSETCKGLGRAHPSHQRVVIYLKLLVSDKHVHPWALKPEIFKMRLTVMGWIPFNVGSCIPRKLKEPELSSLFLIPWKIAHS